LSLSHKLTKIGCKYTSFRGERQTGKERFHRFFATF
jgi:hypothetical protein